MNDNLHLGIRDLKVVPLFVVIYATCVHPTLLHAGFHGLIQIFYNCIAHQQRDIDTQLGIRKRRNCVTYETASQTIDHNIRFVKDTWVKQ